LLKNVPKIKVFLLTAAVSQTKSQSKIAGLIAGRCHQRWAGKKAVKK